MSLDSSSPRAHRDGQFRLLLCRNPMVLDFLSRQALSMLLNVIGFLSPNYTGLYRFVVNCRGQR